ncbi:MAG: hypothetical protein ABIT08_08195 [Bacteroidia bacterium]
MNQNKNTSSKLEMLFENARKQEPVVNLNEVSELLKNPAAHQKKKESNSWRWFGLFLLIGVTAFGAFYLNTNNSATEEKPETALVITTVTPSSNKATPPKAPASGKTNDLSAVADHNTNSAPTENILNENKEGNNTASPNNVAPDDIAPRDAPSSESGKNVLSTGKAETKHATVKHYEGDATISFLSDDNKKIKMTVTPSNEVIGFKVNDEAIPNEKYSEYKNIIDEGLKLKNDQQKKSSGTVPVSDPAHASKRNLSSAIMNQLTADGLISGNEPFDFTLTGQEVILNNQKQTQETFEKFKQLYEKTAGEKLPAKYNFHIKR